MFFFNDSYERKIEIHAITVLLFLSMLPLHNDNHSRQMTMLANAVRLYEDLIRSDL